MFDKIIKLSVDNPVFVNLLFWLITIAGIIGAMKLPREQFPEVSLDAVQIEVLYVGATASDVALLIRHRRHARIERHVAAAEVWAGAAELAPAMGMVGTLIGLAQMFATMSDPTAIVGAMAIALLATLYGALLANLVFMPVANRLRAQGRNEAFERARIEAPLVALAAREAPRAPLMSVA